MKKIKAFLFCGILNAISPDKYRSIHIFFDTIPILFAKLMLYNKTVKLKL